MSTLALPYMYRAVDTGLRAIDVRTLTEAAESLGAGAATILFRVILPNVRSAMLSGAFLTFAIVIGEFTMASLLNRPAFGPYLQLIGANRAYEPAALAIIAFAVTWACMGLIQLFGRGAHAASTDATRRKADGIPRAIEHLDKAFGADAVVQDFNLAVERGEFVSFLGPVGLRQDHDAAHGRRLRAADRGRRSASTAATSRTLRPQPAQCRHGVPVLCAVSQHDGGAERRLRPEGRQAVRRPRSRRASPRC